MVDIGIGEPTIEHVCRIIANHHSAREIDTLEFRILWDSDWLVNLSDECPFAAREKLRAFIDKTFKTKTGKQKAYQLFFENCKEE